MNDRQKPDLKQVLVHAKLPALPQSAIHLLELLQDAENGPAEFAATIEADPGLTSQVLRFANSSHFGFSREIPSVKLAVILIGARTITNFALWHAVYSLTPDPQCGPFNLKSLWQDSLRRGVFSRAVGRLLGMKDAEDLFVASLLQDMAVPLLAKELPQQYEEMLNRRMADQARLSELEHKCLGWNHAAAAGMVARDWGLPEELVELIETHADVAVFASATAPELGRFVVGLSALLPSARDPDWVECDCFEYAFAKIRDEHWPELSALLEQVDDEYQQFAPLLDLSKPGRSLVDSYLAVQGKAVGSPQ